MSEPAQPGIDRRRFLSRAALTGAGAVVAGAAGFGVAKATESGASTPASPVAAAQVPFYGAQQAGIATPAQDRLAFATFDVTTTDTQAAQGCSGSGRRRAHG